jgi:two-component system nitrogen regulation sensor histidine kinase NtrY
MGAATTPRRFRRRLLAVMLILGLLPLLTWAAASRILATRVLAVRTAQLEVLLSRVDAQLAAKAADPALRAEVAAARLNLAQTELARRSLAHLMPRLLVFTLVASAALLCLAAFVLGRQLARPVELLADGMARYARGDLAHRLPVSAGRADELQLLVRQFNRMGDELAAQRARLEVSEAIAAWQGVARALAHELKNPLTAMRMAIARLARSEAAPAAAPAVSAEARQRESLALVEDQIEVLLRLAQSFSAFAKLPAPELQMIEIRPIVEGVCALYRHASPVPVACDVPAAALRADAGLLTRALGNLVKNAVEASAPGGEPVLVSACVEEGSLRIEVKDRGCGIGKLLEGAALARSLGTTKAEGSGLGLPIAHRIVHEHGGSLRIEPRDGGGTKAVVRLPLGENA